MGRQQKVGRLDQEGFTLIELLVVIVIMGLAYAIASPLISSGVTGAELKASARQLAAGLRRVRAEAISQRREVTLTIDLENRWFWVGNDTKSHKLPRSVAIELYTAQSEKIGNSTGAIRFFPDGGSTGGRITVSAKDRSYGVDVNWLTGQVAILD